MTDSLTDQESLALLRIAREAIEAQVKEGHYEVRPCSEAALNLPCGCFVTITRDKQLRGCIGNFRTDNPLYHEVAEMAMAAASQDPRFPPMDTRDLENFSLEISVLSPLRKITDPEEIRVGTHGIYLEKGHRRGVLLPQVATEYGWDRETFLQQTCRKAGLPDHAWQDSGIDIFIFSARILKES